MTTDAKANKSDNWVDVIFINILIKYISHSSPALKTKTCHDANTGVTGGIDVCHHNNDAQPK